MKTKITILAIAVSLLVGVGIGWLVSQVQNAHKLSPSAVLVNGWISDVELLTPNGRDTQLIEPSTVALLVGSDLNIKSEIIGRVYDRMPSSTQDRLLFYLPAAHAIAAAQTGPGPEQNRHHILVLVNCLQKVKAQGGLVGECVRDKH